MRCIFCLDERPGTEEHVFPLAIGGSLTTDRVCGPCNSELGRRVDAALSDNFLVKGHRARLRLAGNSGKPPPIHEALLGIGRLADNPEQRVEITFDKRNNKLVVRALPLISDIFMEDGKKARKIVVDGSDHHELAIIVQRERKRHGLIPLSSEALKREISNFEKTIIDIKNPKIILEKSYSFAFVRHAMIKIAYELAFLWLGEDYLDDPSAAELRSAICADDQNSTDSIPAYVTDAENFEAFKLWPSSETEHLAYALVGNDGIAIAVRVFNIHAALVWVTRETTRFISPQNVNQKLRFIRLDALSKKKLDIPLVDELLRIANKIVAENSTGKNSPYRP